MAALSYPFFLAEPGELIRMMVRYKPITAMATTKADLAENDGFRAALRVPEYMVVCGLEQLQLLPDQGSFPLLCFFICKDIKIN